MVTRTYDELLVAVADEDLPLARRIDAAEAIANILRSRRPEPRPFMEWSHIGLPPAAVPPSKKKGAKVA